MDKSKIKRLLISCFVLFVLTMLAFLLDGFGDYFSHIKQWSLEVRELLSFAALGIIFFAMLICMGSVVHTLYPNEEKKLLDAEQKKKFCFKKRLTVCVCGTVFNLLLTRSLVLILKLYFDFENGAIYVTNVGSGQTVKELVNWSVVIYLLTILFALLAVIMVVRAVVNGWKSKKNKGGEEV